MKRYTKKTAGLIFLLLATSVTFGLLVAFQFYISAIVTFALILFEGYYLFHMMERNDRLFKQFIWSIRYSDFLASGTPLQKQNDKIPQDMVKVMEEALQHYKKHLQEKESQLQYFQALANHIDLSVFVYSATGQIEWMNQAFKIQTGLNFAETIDDLATYHPELPACLRTLHPGELSILQVRRKDEYSQLILSAISFVVLGKPLTVVSMKNIRSVLENKETEAWQKLIRVLTHEIMNSMTPIVSLSELLRNKCIDELGVDTEDQPSCRNDFPQEQRLGTLRRKLPESYGHPDAYSGDYTGQPFPGQHQPPVQGPERQDQDRPRDGTPTSYCRQRIDRTSADQPGQECFGRNTPLSEATDRTVCRHQRRGQNLYPGKRQRDRHTG
mgnify:CR=1 FL=1